MEENLEMATLSVQANDTSLENGMIDITVVDDTSIMESNCLTLDMITNAEKEKPTKFSDYVAFKSYEHFQDTFNSYQKSSLTSFCTASNSKDFSKNGNML